jgi:Uma2 family endonuclease
MNAQSQDLLHRHRFTVEEYYRMAEVGLLAPDARVELIQGEVIDMAPIGLEHCALTSALNKYVSLAVGDLAQVNVGLPIYLGDYSAPQPDLALLKPRRDFYASGHPTADDVLLLVEISDSTLRYDRDIKSRLYATFGVIEVWIIDVRARRLVRMRQPGNNGYTATDTLTGGPLAPEALSSVTVDLDALFGVLAPN